jgi:dTDP-D-glucose 4,6-dehydratase
VLNGLSEKLLGRPLEIFNRDERLGDVSYECDIKKVRTGLLFNPNYSLKLGLETTFKWFLDNLEV